MKTLLAILLTVFTLTTAAQVPQPTVPIGGLIGANGLSPTLNGGTFSIPTDANYTVAYPNNTCISCTITSATALTAMRNVVMPSGYFIQNVCNYTIGGQSIQIIGPTGTGAIVPNDTCSWVKFDGTNYVLTGGGGGGGSVLLNPTTTQNVTQPSGTLLAVAGGLDNQQSILSPSVTSVIPSSTLSPIINDVNWPFEYVTAQGVNPSELYVYNISTGSQVLAFSYSVPCQYLNGISHTDIGGTTYFVTTCNDTGVLYVYKSNGDGSLTLSGQVSGLTNPYPGLTIDPANPSKVFIPLLGVPGTSPGAVAEVNISNPASPVLVGSVTLANNAAGGVQGTPYLASGGGYVYAVCGHEPTAANDSSVQVVSEQTLTLIGTPLPLDHSPQMDWLQGTTLYVTNFDSQEFVSIDVTNPAAPTILETLPISSCNEIPVIVRGNYAYVGCNAQNNVQVIDITNPASMQLVTTYNGFNAPQRFSFGGRYLMLTGYSGPGGSVYQIDTGGLSTTKSDLGSASADNIAAGQIYGNQIFSPYVRSTSGVFGNSTAFNATATNLSTAYFQQQCVTGATTCKPIFNNPTGPIEMDVNGVGVSITQFSSNGYQWDFGLYGSSSFVLRDATNGNLPFQIQAGATNNEMTVSAGGSVLIPGVASSSSPKSSLVLGPSGGYSGSVSAVLIQANNPVSGTTNVLTLTPETGGGQGNLFLTSPGELTLTTNDGEGIYLNQPTTVNGNFTATNTVIAEQLLQAKTFASLTSITPGVSCSGGGIAANSWFLDPSGNVAFCNGTKIVPLTSTSYCSSSASPAVCGSNINGFVDIATGATSVVVDTTAIGATSVITVTEDQSLGSQLGVTCNTGTNTPKVTARSAGTSFTISVASAPSTNPACISFQIIH